MQQQFNDLETEMERQRVELQELHLQQQNTGARRMPIIPLPTFRSGFDFFAGRSGENFDTYIDRFNRQSQANGWDETQKRLVLPSLLREAAETVYRNIPSELKQQMNYGDLVESLRNRFKPAQACEIKNAELQTRIQRPNETVMEYAVAIQQLATDAYPELSVDSRDQLIKRFFINGLQQHLWQCVLNRNVTSFADAEAAARDAEAQYFLRSRYMPNVQAPQERHYGIFNRTDSQPSRTVDGRPICFNCGRPGHTRINCRQQQQPRYNNNFVRSQTFQRQPTHNNRFRSDFQQPHFNHSNQQNSRFRGNPNNNRQTYEQNRSNGQRRQFWSQQREDHWPQNNRFSAPAPSTNRINYIDQHGLEPSTIEPERFTTTVPQEQSASHEELRAQNATLRRQIDRLVLTNLQNQSISPQIHHVNNFALKNSIISCENFLENFSKSEDNCFSSIVLNDEVFEKIETSVMLCKPEKTIENNTLSFSNHYCTINPLDTLWKTVGRIFNIKFRILKLSRSYLFFIGVLLTFQLFCVCMPVTMSLADDYYFCGAGKSGYLVSVPREVNCVPPYVQDHKKDIIVDVYVPNHDLNSAKAWKCRTRERRVCTNVGFFGSKGLVSDETTEKSVTFGECRSAVLTKQWQGESLIELSDSFYTTNNSLHVEFKYCCTDYCSVVRNFLLEAGQVATFDGHTMTSDLGDVGSCYATSSYCDARSGMIIWNATELKQTCRFKLLKQFPASKSGAYFIIDDLQGAFSISDLNITNLIGNHCLPKTAIITAQGIALNLIDLKHITKRVVTKKFTNSPKTKSGATIMNNRNDPVNGKLQYLEYKLESYELSNFRDLWLQLCNLASRQLNFIHKLLQIDASLGAQVLLQKDNVHANFMGNVLAVRECAVVKADEIYWEYEYNKTCYSFLPILSNKSLYFALPGSRNLVMQSPIVDCNHQFFGVYHDSKFGWKSPKGPIHVTELGLDILFKNKQSPIIFSKPAIFHDQLTNAFPSIGMLTHYMWKLNNMGLKLENLITYAASTSLYPDTFQNVMNSIETGSKSLITWHEKNINKFLTSATHLTSDLLSGPVQFLINIIIIIGLTAILLCVLYMVIRFRMWKLCARRRRSNDTVTLSSLLRNLNDNTQAQVSNASQLDRVQKPIVPPRPQQLPKKRSRSETPVVFVYLLQEDADQLLIWLNINGHGTVALIDTGATISILDTNFIKQFGPCIVSPTRVKAKSVTGHYVKFDGEISVEMEIDTTKIFTRLFLMTQSPCNVIIGRDVIKQLGNFFAIDFETNFVYLGHNTRTPLIDNSTMNYHNNIPKEHTVYVFSNAESISTNVQIAENTVLQPKSITSLPVKLTNQITNGFLLFTPVEEFCMKYDVMLNPSLQIDSENIFLDVINYTSNPIILYKNSVCGTVNSYTPVELYCNTVPNKVSTIILHDLVEQAKTINTEQKAFLFEFLETNQHVFAFSEDELGRTNMVKHQIVLTKDEPIKQRPYRLPYHQREEIEKHVKNMLDSGIIEPSASPWASPVVMVHKKTGGERFCVDYRKLNDVTKKDTYPLPRIDDIIDTIGSSTYFSCLDLASGYWQIELHDEAKEKTAFTTFSGLYQFNVMPFGLCCAPATFQRLIERVLHGLLWKICFVYLDDILVCVNSFEDHLNNLKIVFERLDQANLKLKPSKCRFFMEEVPFLGHLICNNGVKPDPSKVSSVQNFPRPENTNHLRSFLGLCSYYRRFVADFSQIAEPLHKLLKKNIKFIWTNDCENAFQQLKSSLCKAPVLRFPDYRKTFLIQTDASQFGLGAILAQVHADGEHPVSFASRTLSKAERNYATIEKEALAVIWALKHFRPYIYGQKCVLMTDHAPLQYLKRAISATSPRLTRWGLVLQQYNLEIKYKSGREHTNADALSRLPLDVSPQINFVQIPDEFNLQSLQDTDQVCHGFKNFLENGLLPNDENLTKLILADYSAYSVKEGILCKNINKLDVIVIPKTLIPEILEAFHDDVFAGHLGYHKTLEKIKDRYFWFNMNTDIYNHCKNCLSCAGRKHMSHKVCHELVPIVVPEKPFTKMAVDILGPLPLTYNGNRHVIIFGDYTTKWIEAFPIVDMKAETVAKLFVENIVCRFGSPNELLSDQGTNFTSNIVKEVTKMCNTRKIFTTPYHPQTDGMVERFNSTLLTMISMYVSTNQRDWDTLLPYMLFAYRTSKHATTKYTPFFLLYGFESRLPIDSVLNANFTDYMIDLDDFVFHITQNFTNAWKLANDNIKTQQLRQKTNYDKKVFVQNILKNDLVLIYKPANKVGRSPKLTHTWVGPYRVVDVQTPNVIVCDTKNVSKTQKLHLNNVKLFRNADQNLHEIDPNLDVEEIE